jgi:uncharacterized protein (TIGR02246 family)
MKSDSLPRRLSILLIGTATLLTLQAAEPGDSRQQLAKIEKELAAALEKNDFKLMAPILSDDWKLVDADGTVHSREEIQEMMASGKLKFESYSSSEFDIRLYGDTAVVIGRDNSKGTFDGEQFSTAGRFTDVFVKRDGHWKLVASHSTTISE